MEIKDLHISQKETAKDFQQFGVSSKSEVKVIKIVYDIQKKIS